jgi:hydrogenase maturation protease
MGMGNQLFSDEGLGVHVAQRMADMPLPEGVDVLDAGAVGYDMLFYIEDYDKVIAIDAVKQGNAPGTIYRLNETDLQSMPTEFFSLFHLKLTSALQEAAFTGKKLEVVMIGVEPKVISQAGLELSDELEASVPKVIARVLEEIGPASFQN